MPQGWNASPSKPAVGAEVADVHIQGDPGDFRPGVQGEVGFCQDNGPRDAGGLVCGIAELVEAAADHREPVTLAGGQGEVLQARGVEESGRRAAAFEKVGDEVESPHGGILGAIGRLELAWR
jgi:hypothetical protein